MKSIMALFIGVCFFAAVADAPAQGHYVSPSGDDGYAGSMAAPWRTLEKAAAEATAGDTVYIMEGVYRERLLPQNSGSAGAYITYRSYPGATAVIDGADLTVPQYSGLVDLAGRQFIRIVGLRVMNSTQAGILADGTSDIVIEGNSVANTASSGIGVWSSSRVLVSGNTVEGACTSGDQECISVAGTSSFVVSDNVVFDCRKEGICLKDGSSYGEALRNHVHHSDHVGIYVDAWDKHTFNIDVHRNLVHEAVLKSGIMLASEQGGQLENVRVYNNISYGNAFDGISISDCCPGAARHPIRNVLIVNNTFFGNGTSGWGGGIGLENNPDLEGIAIRNNICSGNASFQIIVDAGLLQSRVIVDHNLIDGFRGEESEIRGDDAVEGDPLFVDAAALDFHLRRGSPAIDAGVPVPFLAVDYDGSARPSGAGIDIGAFEWDAGTRIEESGPALPHVPYLHQNYPNPFNPLTTIEFSVPHTGFVHLIIFNAYGHTIGTLVADELRPGSYRVTWDAGDLPSGVYYYRLEAGGYSRARSMLLIR